MVCILWSIKKGVIVLHVLNTTNANKYFNNVQIVNLFSVVVLLLD